MCKIQKYFVWAAEAFNGNHRFLWLGMSKVDFCKLFFFYPSCLHAIINLSKERRFCVFFLFFFAPLFVYIFFLAKYASKLFKPVLHFHTSIVAQTYYTYWFIYFWYVFCVLPLCVLVIWMCVRGYIERNRASRKSWYIQNDNFMYIHAHEKNTWIFCAPVYPEEETPNEYSYRYSFDYCLKWSVMVDDK